MSQQSGHEQSSREQVDRDRLKRLAAERAVEEVRDGMVLGLGTGSTAAFAVAALAIRIADGLRVTGIPTSEKTAALARRLAVPLTDFTEHRSIDLTIDGADQVEPSTLNAIKGHGGSLLREKIVASASRQVITIIDDSKLTQCLGDPVALPVEVVPFGWQMVVPHLEAIGLSPTLRIENGQPFITDSGNHILDCKTGAINNAAMLERKLAAIVGVVESGLFIGIATKVIVAHTAGIEILEHRNT